MDNNEIKAKLEEYEKKIEAVKKLRDEAIKTKTECETKISIATEELRQMKVNPDKIDEELESLNKEIEQQLKEIEGSIPFDLLSSCRG